MSLSRVVEVVLAAPDHPREADALRVLTQASGVRVSRRCVDISDFLSVVLAGLASAAVIDTSMHGLDADAVARCHAAGVRIVGLLACGATEDETTRVSRLGLDDIVAAEGDIDVVEALVQAPLRRDEMPSAVGHADAATLTEGSADNDVDPCDGPTDRAGRVIVVWGPIGAPGRTSISLGLAAEFARTGQQVMLVDADTFGASIAIRLGLLDEAPGIAAAARAANSGALDDAAFARIARRVRPGLDVLTGISRPSRWRELRPSALAHVWDAARRRADVTIIDIGFCIESDETGHFESGAPTRSSAALSALQHADDVLAVGIADPVGVARLIPGVAAVRELAPTAALHVIANRVKRRYADARDFADVLARHSHSKVAAAVADDQDTLHAMTAQGLLPTELRGRSAFATDMRALAHRLTGPAARTHSAESLADPTRAGKRRLARIAN